MIYEYTIEDYGFEEFDDFYENPEKYEMEDICCSKHQTYILKSTKIPELLLKIGKDFSTEHEGEWIAYTFKGSNYPFALGSSCPIPTSEYEKATYKNKDEIKKDFLVKYISGIEEIQNMMLCYKEKVDLQELISESTLIRRKDAL